MSISSWDIVENEHKQKVVRLKVQAGTHQSNVEIYLYGAHITKWEETNKAPFLFLSDKALTDGSKAIRGMCCVVLC
jgi:D-hexose-6-phosphate mutarotase